jgi:hypothetical protein
MARGQLGDSRAKFMQRSPWLPRTTSVSGVLIRLSSCERFERGKAEERRSGLVQHEWVAGRQVEVKHETLGPRSSFREADLVAGGCWQQRLEKPPDHAKHAWYVEHNEPLERFGVHVVQQAVDLGEPHVSCWLGSQYSSEDSALTSAAG